MTPQAAAHRHAVRELFAQAREQGDPAAGLELALLLRRSKPAQPHPDIDRAWEAALQAPWDRPDAIAPAALAYLAREPDVARALTPMGDEAALDQATAWLARSRIFQLVASSAVITPLPWLALLLRWRSRALQRGASHAQPGLAWLALQSHQAQYVWPTDVPRDALDALRSRVGVESPLAVDVMLLACFEHPGVQAQEALSEADPGQDLLLARLWREPAQERLIAARLAAAAKQPLPQIAQREQYERYPYPAWTREPLLPAAVPPAVQALRRERWWRKERVLIAGCGTGLQCLSARMTYEKAAITAIDFSLQSIAYAARKCGEAGLGGIAFEHADLLAYRQRGEGKRGERFDIVECIGVLHHLTALEPGAAALAALTRPGGLLRLAVYSASTREPILALRRMIAARGLDGSIGSLRQVRAELLAGQHGPVSRSLLESPDLHSASGLHDLLFNACEHSMGAVAWCELMARHGFELVCMDPPAATLEQAGPGSQDWSPAQWEAFESAHPYAFASMYEFWFRK